MALYLGTSNDIKIISSDGYVLQDLDSLYLTALPSTSKFKINLNGIAYRLNIELPLKERE